jgi:integrase
MAAAAKLTERAVQAAKAKDGERLELWDSSTPGLCLRVSAKDGLQTRTWVWRYRTNDGRQPRLKLGEHSQAFGLAEAREQVGALRVLVRGGGDPAADRRRIRTAAKAEPLKTFDDLAVAYFAACEAGEWKPKGKVKRPRTLADERDIYARYLKAALGDERLDEIGRPMVKAAIRAVIARGVIARANRAHAIARQMFAYAIAEERLTVNPATGFQPLASETPRARTLTDDELKALWTGLKDPAALTIAQDGGEPKSVNVGRPMAILLQLCVLLLQRRGEIAGMRRSELNLGQGTWLIPAERMKGGVAHLVPLPPKAVTLIQEALTLADDLARRRAKEGENAAEAQCVFPSRSSLDAPIRGDSVNHAMRLICTAQAIKDASPHDLRRTGSTALTSERLGVSPFIRSKVLGHRGDTGGGSAVSMIHYDANTYIAEKRRALEAWEALLLEVVGERERPSNVTDIRAMTA